MEDKIILLILKVFVKIVSIIEIIIKKQRVFQERKARQNFQKTNITYPLIRTRTCAYQGVRNVYFSEIFTCTPFLKHPFEIHPFALLLTTLLLVVFRHKSFFSLISRSLGNGTLVVCAKDVLMIPIKHI